MNSDYVVNSRELGDGSWEVYVYDKNDNNSIATINDPYPTNYNSRFFGERLAISPNNTIVIGASRTSYIYTIVDGTWTMTYQDTSTLVYPYIVGNFITIGIDVNDTVVVVYSDKILVYMVSGGIWSKTHTIDRNNINFAHTEWSTYNIYLHMTIIL